MRTAAAGEVQRSVGGLVVRPCGARKLSSAAVHTNAPLYTCQTTLRFADTLLGGQLRQTGARPPNPPGPRVPQGGPGLKEALWPWPRARALL